MQQTVTLNEEIVSITTVNVGSRRMSKAVFNQIIQTNPFDRQLHFRADKLLGCITDKGDKWLLFIHEGRLRRYNVEYYKQFAFLGKYVNVQALKFIVSRIRIDIPDPDEESSEYDTIERAYSNESLETILSISGYAREFYKSLDDKQLFIGS